MTFYSRPPGFSEPRDPREIHEQVAEAGSFLTLIALAVIVAITFGLYFLYAGAAPKQPIIAAPPAAQLSAPVQNSAAQPSTQTPTP
jgi:tellurite resistance protein TehA-like permease